MKGIGRGFQIIYQFVEFYYSKKNFIFQGVNDDKIWVKCVIFLRSYLTNLIFIKSIDIWQLSLNTIEWLWKSRVFGDICKIIGIYVKFHKKIKKVLQPKNLRIFKFWLLHVQLQSKVIQKKELTFFFSKFCSGKGFFLHFSVFFLSIFIYAHRIAEPQIRFGWNFKKLKTLQRATIACRQNLEIRTISRLKSVSNLENRWKLLCWKSWKCSRSISIYRTEKINV